MPLHTERASGDGLGDWRDSFIPLHCSECKKNRQSNVALHAHVCTFTLYKIKSYRLDWSLNIAAWIHTCDFLKLFGYKARQSSGIEKVPKHATAPKKPGADRLFFSSRAADALIRFGLPLVVLLVLLMINFNFVRSIYFYLLRGYVPSTTWSRTLTKMQLELGGSVYYK